MRAAVVTADRSVAAVTIERPAPAAGEVLLTVSYCGICGSDLHMLGAPDGCPPGHVLGHEFTGVVAELGQKADGWAVGDRVVVDPLISCGECDPCRTGHPNLCEQEGIDHGPGIGRQGAYAESVAVPAGMLRRLPDTVSDADGALIEPLAVAIRAIKVSGATPDEPVCVLGAGPIGMLAVASLQARGFSRIAVVEPIPGRRAAVQRLGVAAVAPDEAMTGVPSQLDEPPAVAIDATGDPTGAPLAIELLRPAGRLTIVGLPDDPAPIDLAAIAFKELIVRGSLCSSDGDFSEAIDYIAGGRIPCHQIVTTTASLDDAATVLKDLRSGATEQVKVLLRPG